ncbi:CLUMA_CG002446, isoform A [Clunio marinus]|uniref:CLUMA_CG002446, isoform A n=1 Tax=Clunio marinus TaxID=568069 RepID=A0A1J1HKW2_9DIPT|nr:CLUMA_CG002446, isoform A [Clunio marinus]
MLKQTFSHNIIDPNHRLTTLSVEKQKRQKQAAKSVEKKQKITNKQRKTRRNSVDKRNSEEKGDPIFTEYHFDVDLEKKKKAETTRQQQPTTTLIYIVHPPFSHPIK